MRLSHLAIGVIAAIFLSLIGSFALRSVWAQTTGTVGPLACTTDAGCPSGQACMLGRCNLPSPIWNLSPLVASQSNTGFNISEYGKIGKDLSVSGLLIVGKDLTVGDGVVVGKTLSVAGGKLTVDLSGNLTSSGCVGGVFVGTTAGPQDGNRGGYTATHTICKGALAGSHVCATSEILQSISCGNSTILSASGFAWINNGPPAYLAQANDCKGWTSNAPDVYGTIWGFSATGGQGNLTGCNTTRVFACCK